ncbi:LuxR C-terminal-related transcriptional regulator [Indioceanicola profundi]|uniref:LuxR C-terminal-related transcriptional regulator n=1 Tax=Indioceanicola profundi TaxID=2220096 RepID=UPI0013C504C9|nr:response regulator transcription factor [Indioceanicola profundi]
MDHTGLLIIDPCNLFRAGLGCILPQDMQVIVEAGDVATALRLLSARDLKDRVDIVLLDVAADQSLGTDILTLKEALPGVRIVHLTATPTAGRLQTVFEAGADGCLTKDRSVEALAQAMRLVAMGEKVFPSELMRLLREAPYSEATNVRMSGLSGRETQILRALLDGESNKVIANALRIREATVKVHLKSLMRKLKVTNRTQAAMWAMNNGMASSHQAQITLAGNDR